MLWECMPYVVKTSVQENVFKTFVDILKNSGQLPKNVRPTFYKRLTNVLICKALSYINDIFTHLHLRLASATHNFK